MLQALHQPSKQPVGPLLAEMAGSPPTPAKLPAKRGRKPIVHRNTLKPYLSAFGAPGLALDASPELASIVSAVVHLDMGGNTRPLSKKLVVAMLARFDEISADAVQQYMHLTLRPCLTRHSQNIASCLRVIVNAAEKLNLPEPTVKTEEYGIAPCGNPYCPVCAIQSDVEMDALELDWAGMN